MAGAAIPVPGRATEFTLSAGPDGVKQTLYLMARLTRQYRSNPYITTQARLALRNVSGKNFKGEAAALLRYVQNAIRYTQDPVDVEHLTAPDILLRDVRAGDCDDMSLLLGTLLQAVGHPVRYVAVGFDYDPPGELTHVFVQTRIGNAWLSLDPSEPYAAGWEPPNVARCFPVNV